MILQVDMGLVIPLTPEQAKAKAEHEAWKKHQAARTKRHLNSRPYDGDLPYEQDPRLYRSEILRIIPPGEWVWWHDICDELCPFGSGLEVGGISYMLDWLRDRGVLKEKEKYYVPPGKNPWISPHLVPGQPYEYRGFQFAHARVATPDPVWVEEEENLKLEAEHGGE